MGITSLQLIHSRWPKIYFMQQNTSATTTIAISRELFAKYGFPVHCVVENSPQFRSEEFAHFMKVNGVKRRCQYVSCLQIFVVIVSYKIFKCDSINVFKIGNSQIALLKSIAAKRLQWTSCDHEDSWWQLFDLVTNNPFFQIQSLLKKIIITAGYAWSNEPSSSTF